MFFSKSYCLTRQLREALKLVKRAMSLAAPYLYEEGRQLTPAEITLLEALRHAHQQHEAYLGHVLNKTAAPQQKNPCPQG